MEDTKEVPKTKTVTKNVFAGRNPDTNRPYFRRVKQPVIPPEGIEPPSIDKVPPPGIQEGTLSKDKPPEIDVTKPWRWTDNDKD